MFVANVTGNVGFLAFGLAGAPGLSIAGSLAAYGSFALGSLLGGRVAVVLGNNRGRTLGVAASGQAVLLAAASALSGAGGAGEAGGFRYWLILLLAVAMGLQNATARRLAVPDPTTTVLTLPTTGMFADAKLVGGPGSRVGRRLLSIVAMAAGALLGAALVGRGAQPAALGLALLLVALVGLLANLLSGGRPVWSRP